MAVVGLRTSSIRKMWRDLESDGRAGENLGVITAPESPCSSSLEVESMESEDTSRYVNEIENECPPNQRVLQNGQVDIPEKDRVRKIFHDWGSKSRGGNTLYSSRMNNCSRAKRLGENECKRVRIVREWIESSTQQGDSCRPGSEEPATEIGSQIKRIRDGTVNSGAGVRTSMRRIYGRQALLDLLKKFVRERETELERLMENQFVSNFGHRQRIQSLLKGRFLRNQTFVEDEKQIYVAASELGLLRQTHVVSDKRKGFLSRLNKDHHAVEGDQSDSDTSSENQMDYDRTEHAEEIVQEIPDEIGKKTEIISLSIKPELASALGERHDNNEREKLPLSVDSDALSDNEIKYERIEQAEELVQETPDEIGEEFEITNLICNWESLNQQERASPIGDSCDNVLQYEEREKSPLDVEFTETRSQYQDGSEQRNQNGHNIELSQGTMGTNVEELEMQVPPVRLHPLQTNTDSFNWHESEDGDDDDDDGIGSDEGIDVISNENEHEWYQETLRSDFQEYHEEWYDNDMEDATESWFGGNSYLEAALADRSNAFYSSDDDNGSRKVELRELTNRGRVSNLLQSGFGARLDRILQSYLDRRDQAFESENGWQDDHEHQSLDGSEGGIDAVDRNEGSVLSPSVIPQIHGDNDLLQDADDRPTEREIINGLRIDMNTLQERMNDMQKMVEACMDMQLQLQRSMKQEVYSALKRLSKSETLSCFLCCDDGFESLPDRSVHMYICSKCAEKINLSKLKECVSHP